MAYKTKQFSDEEVSGKKDYPIFKILQQHIDDHVVRLRGGSRGGAIGGSPLFLK